MPLVVTHVAAEDVDPAVYIQSPPPHALHTTSPHPLVESPLHPQSSVKVILNPLPNTLPHQPLVPTMTSTTLSLPVTTNTEAEKQNFSNIEAANPEVPTPHNINLRQSTRDKKRPRKLDDYELLFSLCSDQAEPLDLQPLYLKNFVFQPLCL